MFGVYIKVPEDLIFYEVLFLETVPPLYIEHSVRGTKFQEVERKRLHPHVQWNRNRVAGSILDSFEDKQTPISRKQISRIMTKTVI